MIAINKVILSSASQSQLATSWQPDRPFLNHAIKKGYVVKHNPLILLVGTAGFELATPCTPCFQNAVLYSPMLSCDKC